MRIIEVNDQATARDFLKVPKQLYRKDKNWICPLDAEIEGIFNPKNNICFSTGEAIRWILLDDRDNLIGRIAAFYDTRKTNHFDYPTGGAGFFECIDAQEAANILFDTAKNWLLSKGMQAMQAPINFGENYNYWGLLIEGFLPQGYGMPYNFPYYRQLFENYGFRNFFEQLSFHKDLEEKFPERLVKFALYMEQRPGYSFEHFSFRNIEKYVDDFVYAYNAIWEKFHDNYTPLKHDEIRKLVEEARLVIDEEFIWFAYDKGKPAGLLVVFPDINQILKKLKNGKLNFFNKLKFYYYRKRAITRTRVFIAGVLPEYQNSGIIGALFYQLVRVLERRPKHKQIELSWVGDYNPKMLGIYDKIGGKLAKRHVTYMYLFDPKASFRRFDNEFEGKLYTYDRVKY
jgi:GNAT superfamily N-acetyltransferase